MNTTNWYDKEKMNQFFKDAKTPNRNTTQTNTQTNVQTPTAEHAKNMTAGTYGGVVGGLMLPGVKKADKPSYTSSYTVNAGNQPYVDQLHSLYDQIVNRKPFRYDLNGDLLYREMADRYTQLGQQAMRDTTGQAAALTGGYGNSYATQVGNQAYQQNMTALNDNIPQLWDRAYQAYLNEGDQLMQKYELTAAHPGYVEALSPRTYTVKTPEDEKKDDPSAGNQSAYNMALINAGLLPGTMGAGATNPFNNYYYELLAEEQKKK